MTQRDQYSEYEIIRGQLREGNAGAQGYFTARVDLMLADTTGASDDLYRFMKVWWPPYKEGVAAKRALGESEGKTDG